MLKKVKFQNWDARFTFAPPVDDLLINTDEIVTAHPHDAERGAGPFVKVTFRNGDTKIIQGTVEDLLK